MRTLYKKNKKGQTQVWKVIVKDNTVCTVEGIKGGKMTTSLPTICTEKNIGRSNYVSAKKQAKLEAERRWKKKIDEGYGISLKVSGRKYFQPMLAEEYHKHMDKLDFDKGVYVQPKLDGLRCDNKDNKCTSRNGNEFDSVPHLHQNKWHLDGELYNHIYKDNFNEILSLLRKKKDLDEEFLKKTKQYMKMYVYDYPQYSDLPFSERYEKLKTEVFNKNRDHLVLVPTYRVYNHEDIKMYHDKFIKEGYEGTIIRLDGIPYENCRTTQLLKYKDFTDSEFKIVGYIEGKGNRTGTIGKFILELDDNSGNTFKCNVKGDFKYLKQIWENVDSYVGKTATVKYHKRTPANVPKWGYIVKIAREDYE